MGSGQSQTAPQDDQSQGAREAEAVTPVRRPCALVVCGPSGVGKGTLIKRLTGGSQRFGFSCSHTTRQPRAGEVNGREYWFTTKQDFEKWIEEGKFLEYAYVHENIYGTSLKAVQDVAAAGKCCVLDIDVQGARLVRASGLPAVFVFVAPPSEAVLEQRLRSRATESDAQVAARMTTAKEEMASMHMPGLFDYILVNGDLEEAVRQLGRVAQRALEGRTGEGRAITLDSAANTPTKGGAGSRQDEPTAVSVPAIPAVPSPAPQGAAGSAGAAPQGPPPASSPEAASNPRRERSPAAANSVPEAAPRPPAGPSAPSRGAAAPEGSRSPPDGGLPAHLTASGLERWRGKVALVTGASAGIGWAVSEALALAGLRVVAVARRRERLEALQQHLLSRGVPVADFLPVVCDVTKEAEVVALPRIIVRRWPGAGVDVLVNNAGLGRDDAALFDGATAAWVAMISTNVLALCMATREAVQDMKRRGSYGHVINISSMSGHRVAKAASGASFYAATKHAVRALTEGLRQEARAQGVPLRVTEISPGMVETEFALAMHSGDAAVARRAYEGMDCLQAEDVAAAVVYCLAAPPHVEINDVLMRPTQQAV